MAKVSEARVEITGKDKTKQAFNAVQNRLKKMKGSLTSMHGAMALVTSAGFVAMGKRALDTADKIGKFSDRAGISTKSLQEMHHAFDLAGVSTEAVDQSLITFGKRLGKARDGIGALTGGLKKGQSQLLANLEATKSNEDALQLIFQAMGNAKDQAEKLAIADAAFGGAGLKMTSAFNDGTLAFESARKEASALGMVLTEDGIRSAEKLNDVFTKLGGAVSGQLSQSFLELTPLLLEHQDSMIRVAKAIGEGLVGAVQLAIPVIKVIIEAFKLAGAVIGTVVSGVQQTIAALGQLAKQGAEFVNQFVAGFEKQWDKVKEKVGGLIPNWMSKFLEQKSPAELGVLDSKKWGSQVPKLFAKGIEDNISSVKSASKKLGITMEDTIGDSLFSLKDGFDGFKDYAIGSLNSIGNSIMRSASSGVGDFLTKSILNVGSSWFGGGRATGGNVSANRSYMVGEKGPEMFSPSSNGFITPNNELAGAGGVNITLNLSTGVQSTVRAEVMGMLPMISENVKHAVSDARLRGGSFSKAMGL